MKRSFILLATLPLLTGCQTYNEIMDGVVNSQNQQSAQQSAENANAFRTQMAQLSGGPQPKAEWGKPVGVPMSALSGSWTIDADRSAEIWVDWFASMAMAQGGQWTSQQQAELMTRMIQSFKMFDANLKLDESGGLAWTSKDFNSSSGIAWATEKFTGGWTLNDGIMRIANPSGTEGNETFDELQLTYHKAGGFEGIVVSGSGFGFVLTRE